MWSAPLEPADRSVATPENVRRRKRDRSRPIAVTSDLELRALPIIRSRASYRRGACDDQGGLRAVIRASSSSESLRRRVGDAAIALCVSLAPTLLAGLVLPPSASKVWLAVIALLIAMIVGGVMGILPGCARAMAQLAAALRGAHADEPQQTVLECRDGAELLVLHGASRSVVPLRALSTLRARTRAGRSCLVVDRDGETFVIANDLSPTDAHALRTALESLAHRHLV